MKKFLFILSTLFIISCGASKNVAEKEIARYNPKFDYTPPERANPRSANITVALINPVFVDEDPTRLVKPYSTFIENMADDFEEMLIAKGFSLRGPFKTRDEIKKGLAGEEIEKEISGINKLVSALTDASNVYGLTAREVALYKAEQLGATEADREAINAAFDRVDAEKEKQRVIADGNKLLTLGTTEADPALLAEVIERDSINEAKLNSERAYIEAVNELRLTGQATAEELLARDVEANRLALENKLINLQQFNDAQVASSQKYLKSQEKTAKSEQKIEANNVGALLSIAQTLVDGNSKVGKLLFVGSQALAASEVFFSTQAAAARALAELGPIAGAPVAAEVERSGAIRLAAIGVALL